MDEFEQVVDLHPNDKARFILQRDVQRTCEYLALQGSPSLLTGSQSLRRRKTKCHQENL